MFSRLYKFKTPMWPAFLERLTGQLRWETFNTFNHTNPICCGSLTATSAVFNQVTSTRDPRIMQIGMKLNF